MAEKSILDHVEGYKNIGCKVELFKIDGGDHKFKLVQTLINGHNIKILKESLYKEDMSYNYRNFEIKTALITMKMLIDEGAY